MENEKNFFLSTSNGPQLLQSSVSYCISICNTVSLNLFKYIIVILL